MNKHFFLVSLLNVVLPLSLHSMESAFDMFSSMSKKELYNTLQKINNTLPHYDIDLQRYRQELTTISDLSKKAYESGAAYRAMFQTNPPSFEQWKEHKQARQKELKDFIIWTNAKIQALEHEAMIIEDLLDQPATKKRR